MRLSVRVSATAAVLAGLLGMVPLATAQSAEAAKVSCTGKTLGGTGNLSGSPVARKLNQKIWTQATIKNETAYAQNGVFYDYEIAAPSNRHTTAPDIWWHVLGGTWHYMPLTWHAAVKGGSDAYWISGDSGIGNLAAHASRTVQFAILFKSGSATGSYLGTMWLGSKSCGYTGLGHLDENFAYQ
jgi:hypothetical protein